MNYRIDRKKNLSAYMQLYEQLRQDISSHRYAYGERLPSKRLIAEEAELSVISVEHAYALLCEEGYAEARQRRGYFVSYREGDLYAAEAAGSMQYAGEISDKTPGGGEKPSPPDGGSFPFSVYARTVRRVLSEAGEMLFERADGKGSIRLRQAIAMYLARSRGIELNVQQLVIGAGSEYLYSCIAQLFPEEKYIAIESPSYEKIRQVYEAEGKRCEGLRMGRNGILSKELSAAPGRLLHVTPYHSYPSGITASAGKLSEYIAWAEERGGYLIEDDFDSEFTLSKKARDTIYACSSSENVIYMNTFHKSIAPSMRVGYMVLPKSLMALYDERLAFYSCPVPLLEQYVLAELIMGGDFERHINRVRRKIRAQRSTQAVESMV